MPVRERDGTGIALRPGTGELWYFRGARAQSSCDGKGVLRFNWRIIQAPMQLVDYVVAHEVVHVSHPDHTKAFWPALGLVGQRRVWI